MTAPSDPAGLPPATQDASRRTWLAAERTWLAWWRTGLAAGGGAIAVGRVLPHLVHGPQWPYRVLGVAYGLLAVAILVIGARRQRRGTEALHRGSFDELSSPLVNGLTAAALVLSAGALAVVLFGP